jgi:arabinose-5-phosphate isomerase
MCSLMSSVDVALRNNGMVHNDSLNDDLVLRAARETIAREIEGLHAVSDALDAQFLRAVRLIASLKGRLIISGMGKSGHIARKIAATLASTGTPAMFVHPAEASHGDLGMITSDDAVLMLSNSGETSELEDMVTYCKRFSIPVMALVRRAESKLVQAADIPVVLPEIPEASPTGAPTTSTAMMLAYGDALAMALLEQRGFTKDDFRVFHPGGKLGKGLLRVAHMMHTGVELPLVSEDADMKHVLLEITAKSFGCAGVVAQDGMLTGVITDGDLRRHMEANILSRKASEVMTRGGVSITSHMLAVEALALMQSKSITSVFVVDDGKAVGIVHIHDCLRAGII